MSPGSRCGPDPERYVGTNLISCRVRSNVSRNGERPRKSEGNAHPTKEDKSDPSEANPRDGFRRRDRPAPAFDREKRGGESLVSASASGKKNGRNPGDRSEEGTGFARTPLSRLAVHTQGAPLILSSRKNRHRGPRAKGPRGEFRTRRSDEYKEDDPNERKGPSDTFSVASDESSGSGHSENRLPRIIKPRKRRKKDRKPVALPAGSAVPEETLSVGEAKDKPEREPTAEETAASEDELHNPKLHHSFEDVTESDPISYSCSPSSCQCRYCDPSGIWDAPVPERPDSVFTGSGPERPGSSRYSPRSDLAPRRSWSEPVQPSSSLWGPTMPHRSNSFSESASWGSNRSEEIRWESLQGCDIDARSSDPDPRDRGLRVSTEIVTSPNGHRDIEIRFYSAFSAV